MWHHGQYIIQYTHTTQKGDTPIEGPQSVFVSCAWSWAKMKRFGVLIAVVFMASLLGKKFKYVRAWRPWRVSDEEFTLLGEWGSAYDCSDSCELATLRNYGRGRGVVCMVNDLALLSCHRRGCHSHGHHTRQLAPCSWPSFLLFDHTAKGFWPFDFL